MEIINKYKNYIIGAIILFILLLVQNCENNKQQRLQGSAKELKEQLQTVKDGVKIAEQNRIKTKDSIKTENAKKEKLIKVLTDKSLQSEKRIVYLQEQNKLNKVRIAKLTYVESAKEFNTIYEGNFATATDISVNLAGDLPNRVLENLSDADECQNIIKEKDSQLVFKSSIISVKDGQIKGLGLSIFSAEKELEQRKKESELSDKLNSNLNKQIKTLKVKNFLNQYVMPVIYVGGGILIGKQIVR